MSCGGVGKAKEAEEVFVSTAELPAVVAVGEDEAELEDEAEAVVVVK